MSKIRTVLMLSANPKGTTPLRIEEELRDVKEGLTRRAKLRDNFALVSEHAVRTRDVQRALLEHNPFILHFSGHGKGSKGLLLENEIGGVKEVSVEAIASLFGLFKDSLKCVVLNACYSEVQAKAISEHIPFVIGMSAEIGDKASVEFSVAFYDAIGAGKGIKFAFDLATVAIKLVGINQAHVPILLARQPDEPLLPTPTTLTFSAYNPQTFTGREEEMRVICERLQGNCRIVAVVGMTGIGKTALAERAIAHLSETGKAMPYIRFSLDDRSIGTDFFSSGAALLRELGDEPTLEDQQDPTNLVGHILSILQAYPCRLQIDSLERLLKGDEQDGWSEFCDPLWLILFQRVLSVNQLASQLLLTTQDIPGELESVGDRFCQLWYCQTVQGLSPQEQLNLFQKLGLQDDQNRLQRIGEFYDGHPLVLQVVADEIRQQPFNGSVAAYWERYGEEFSSATPTGKIDRSRAFRVRVRQRVEQTIESLPESGKQMLYACSVFRRPVPEPFWIEMSESGDPYTAFDFLRGRSLVEYINVSDQTSLVSLHNLIRSVTYGLLKQNNEAWERAERKAADLWLTAYEPPINAPNIEIVRGYLEAFSHYYEVDDLEATKSIFWTHLNTSIQEPLSLQLGTWGYFQEQISLNIKQLDVARKVNDVQEIGRALGNLGQTYSIIGNQQQAVDYLQQALDITRSIGDLPGKALVSGCLGLAYSSIGQYQQAIDYLQDYQRIAQELGDRQGEHRALIGLGSVYTNTGQYNLAIDSLKRSLQISREMNNRQQEINALENLGVTHLMIGQYKQAIEFHQLQLMLAQEIKNRQSEGSALGHLGSVYSSAGQYAQALVYYEQRLAIVQELGDRQREGIALADMGIMCTRVGQYQQAIDYHQRELLLARELDNQYSESTALANLGMVYQCLGQYEQAIDYYQQELRITREIANRPQEGIALSHLGSIYFALGQFEQAVDYYQQELEIVQDIGARSAEGYALSNLGNAYLFIGRYEQAIEIHEQHLKIAKEIGIRQQESCALGGLGLVYQCLGQYDEAISYQQQKLTILREIGDLIEEGITLGILGTLYVSISQYEKAIDYHSQHLTITRDMGDRMSESCALKNLADTYQLLGETEIAQQYAEQALLLAKELGIPLAVECEALLQNLEEAKTRDKLS